MSKPMTTTNKRGFDLPSLCPNCSCLQEVINRMKRNQAMPKTKSSDARLAKLKWRYIDSKDEVCVACQMYWLVKNNPFETRLARHLGDDSQPIRDESNQQSIQGQLYRYVSQEPLDERQRKRQGIDEPLGSIRLIQTSNSTLQQELNDKSPH